jgi:ribose transport system ATP-binding protein
MKNGEIIMTSPVNNIGIPEIVKLMAGKSISAILPFYDDIKPQKEIVLEVKNLNRGIVKNISFKLRKSEILGIAGLVGSGRTEMGRLIFGADKMESGKIFLDGKEVVIRSPRDAIKKGISLLTEDRKGQGLILEMEYYKNVTITNLPKTVSRGLLNPNKEKSDSSEYIDTLSIQTPSVMQVLRNFSGGNQQKVVLAKWLYRDSNILIMDEPTRGIDVGAKDEMYNLFWRMLKQGRSLIIISSELYELIGICHRIIVFSNGRIAGEVERKDFDNEKILTLAYKHYIQ